MIQQDLLSEIVNLLIQSSSEVSDKSKLKLYDVNIIAEDVMAPILSIVFGVELRNLNAESSNYPGIDLATDTYQTYGSNNERIAFQITSDNSITKIKSTLEMYERKEFYNSFDRLYIYNLTEKQPKYQKKSLNEIAAITAGRFSFDLSTQVIDRTDLEKLIKELKPIEKIQQVHGLLRDQYVYRKRSLLSLEIWESEGKVGYGFSNLLGGIDRTTYKSLFAQNLPIHLKDVLAFLFNQFTTEFGNNYSSTVHDDFPNLGFNTYLFAAFRQTKEAYEFIRNDVGNTVPLPEFSENIKQALEKFKNEIDESDFPLVNNPILHPAIIFVKNTSLEILSSAGVDSDSRDNYIRRFNLGITATVVDAFGKENYNQHLESTKDLWIRENEIVFLNDQKKLSSLGFVSGEELQYQETFGTWEDVRNYGPGGEESSSYNKFKNNELQLSELERIERDLKPLTVLIDEYFSSSQKIREGFLANILFLIADFGKGKTSFLKNYASSFAQDYLKTHDGPFPVYFNLNQYDKYSNSPSLGVIANYLAKEYKIDIKEDYFKKKEYIFLLDSLDESGELSETHIERVIKDILGIQNLDCINQRTNRIIIASRPLAKGLIEQITRYHPHPIKKYDKNETFLEDTENYISFYGFKQSQFDGYVQYALQRFMKSSGKKSIDFTENSKRIFSLIERGVTINLHKTLRNGILKDIELKKPIFSYMIFKLITSDTDFMGLGKVGVYISFLNQLTKEAKHRDDTNHKVSLKDEYTYRNILHASALLWQYRRESGEQVSLTKADICRTIEEKEIDKDDRMVLKQFLDVESIHFLSHSYLGEKENTLHFQHQSFAEILLAEYYLKVFIKYAIEEDTDVEEARIRLSVGMPTDQTIDFFTGMVSLLKECVLGDPKVKATLNKRELLIPLLASMTINKHNKKLYSTRLKIQWFEKHEQELFRTNKISKDLLIDFPISVSIFEKITKLCEAIFNSPTIYTLTESQQHTVLFKNELMGTKKRGFYLAMDKWLALIIGNIIYNNIQKKRFFNGLISPSLIFELIRGWNFEAGAIARWASDFFQGIDMREKDETFYLGPLNLDRLNFSHSHFRYCTIKDSSIRSSNFSNCSFLYFEVQNCDIQDTKFHDIDILPINREQDFDFDGSFSLIFSAFNQGLIFPGLLNDKLKGSDTGLVNYGSEKCTLDDDYSLLDSLKCLKGIFAELFKKEATPESILSAFIFQKSRYSTQRNQDSKRSLKKEFSLFLNELYTNQSAK